jgi:hypothetical protein
MSCTYVRRSSESNCSSPLEPAAIIEEDHGNVKRRNAGLRDKPAKVNKDLKNTLIPAEKKNPGTTRLNGIV